MRNIDVDERRARLGVRHRLAAPGRDVESIAGDLVGLHSSDPATVYLSARARIASLTNTDVADALYERRSVLRMHGMRRTMFVVPLDLAAVMNASCTQAYVASERKRFIEMVEAQSLASDGERWLESVASAVLASLSGRGRATAAELTEDVPELALKIRFGGQTKWAGTAGVSTRVLFFLATQGKIVRGRPRGSWISSLYEWARTEDWLGELPPALDKEEASAELITRWLRTFGPGSLTDLKWWTGWTVRQTKAALAACGAVEVALDDDRVGFVLPDDLEPVGPVEDWVALLPSLDPTVMGWKEREWYLGSHYPRLFDRNGNAGPTVWWNGRVVGGWAQRSDGEIVVQLLEDVPPSAQSLVDEEAARLASWLGGTVVTPRFRAPLEKELAANSR